MIKGEGETPKNRVRLMREAMLMSKAELARKAGLSALTIDRVEKGNECRVDTKRKILVALGVKLSEREKVFFEEKLALSQEHTLDRLRESFAPTETELCEVEVSVSSHSMTSGTGKTHK